ncbi:pyrroloquinoline quinone biosynthesis protein PqqE [Saccharothrix sp. ALI-22-I]|uniref:pyrroloquinoline quinone biosynthesis protein PqqE n=1 Tax=Saccharothrix sp. ALI-22-I TaxID=1933778 RepID=UPI00097C3D88|nr:pyrroloquinoline quinone biosynthesis protein PqqE [Saccharothrix sp. ALI-22-I]ONI86190.1 pyrroloquinoline quinone biosynthesis protein PqqE [Saccharothrix sp. ALI-22-I]
MADAPFGLLAELTHRCPLRCGYCSNPVELAGRADELDTGQWRAVFDQARALGVLQVHLSGGEPLARKDLPALVGHASGLGCYVNLVTSGLGLTADRLAELEGVDHVQLSVQDADAAGANLIAGVKAFEHKLKAADVIRDAGLPLTVNVVLHRLNLDHVGEIIALAARMGADRLELANTQYYGWALRNRAALLPTREQLARAGEVVAAAKARSSMEIVYVIADYHEAHPKPCMHGWGARQLTVAPNGDVLPCPAAGVIEGLGIENVKDRALADIWHSSPAFNAFRGFDWMKEPCRTCARRELDFGGCRCQAFQLTGDASATDPVCSLSPHRGAVDLILAGAPAAVEHRAVVR